MYLVVVLDWYTKKIVGHYAGGPCTTKHWLAALDMAVNPPCPDGARGKGLSLMSENGGGPTSVAFMAACSTLEIHQALTSYNNPKGNADTERFMRTLKEEYLWLQEWPCRVKLINGFAHWVAYDNEHYLHSSLGYQTASQLERDDYGRPSPPFLAA
jgi:putative transposase